MRSSLVSILGLALAASCGSAKPTPAKQPPPPHADQLDVAPPVVVPMPSASGELPTDPALLTGKLANGLTYYVRKNGKPEKRAEMWLAVNAGSVLEDDDQRGVAHFVEHMAFNGTKKYPKAEIIGWLEKTGMRFGADVNARTTFDDTAYQLEIPTTDPVVVEHGLDVLHEWAANVSFDPAEVDKERGVVLEERRLGRGFQGRLLDALVPAALPGSKYGVRLPIGTEEIVKTATPETLKRFYHDWYRPELMAVIVVGDIDPAKIKASIEKAFGDLPTATPPKLRPVIDIPSQAKTITLVLKDPELPVTAVAIASKQPRHLIRTEADQRVSLTDSLFSVMLNQRLEELGKQPTAPFLGAAIGKQSILRPIDVWFQGAAVKGDRAAEALEAVATEVARVANRGFVDTEIARAKQNMLHQLEVQAKERDKTPSREYVDDILKGFLSGDALTSIETDLAIAQRIVPAISAADLQAVATRASSEQNRIVLAAGNTKTTLPDEATLLKALASARASASSAYVDDVVAGPLVPTPPAPGTIKSERELKDLGVTEWTLSNGIRVILKPTDFQNDHVVFAGYSLGGTSLAKDADYVAARFAPAIIETSGAGTFSEVQLHKALNGTGVDLNFQFGEQEQVLFGGAQPDHLEQLLQLTYLRLAVPHKDDAAVAAWRDQEIQGRKNQLDEPSVVFNAKFDEVASGKHPRSKLLTGDDFAKLDVEKARTFYQDRFAHGGLTFVLVGSFAIDKVKPLILTYLGGLPTKGKPETGRDIHLVRPKGAVAFEVKQGLEPKASVRLLYHGAATWSREAEHDVESLADALTIRLREDLREDKSGTYGVRVSGHFTRQPKNVVTFEIAFGCAPENVDMLVKAAMAMVATFQKDGPPPEVVDKIKATQKQERETALKQNDFWLGELFGSYRFGDDPAHILTDGKLVDGLTVASIRAAAKRYFGNDHVLGVLRPADVKKP